MRAIRDGKLEEFVVEAILHPETIHENFTKQMHRWEVEWESAMWWVMILIISSRRGARRRCSSSSRLHHLNALLHRCPVSVCLRYELLDTTALYIASCYAQPEIIEWLLGKKGKKGQTSAAAAALVLLVLLT